MAVTDVKGACKGGFRQSRVVARRVRAGGKTWFIGGQAEAGGWMDG